MNATTTPANQDVPPKPDAKPLSMHRLVSLRRKKKISIVSKSTKQFAKAMNAVVRTDGSKTRMVYGKRPEWPSEPEEGEQANGKLTNPAAE